MKNERGIITIWLVVTLILMVTVLMSTYLTLVNKYKRQEQTTEQIKQAYEGENPEEAYKSFFGNSGDTEIEANIFIPIYTVEQLLKIGSSELITIKEERGKKYLFLPNSTYILMSDLEFDVDNWGNILGENTDWTPIGDTEYAFEGNGHTITVTDLFDTVTEFSSLNEFSIMTAEL